MTRYEQLNDCTSHCTDTSLRRLETSDTPQLDALDSLLGIQRRDISALLSPAGLDGYEWASYGLLEAVELVGRADLVYDPSNGRGYLLRFAIRPDRRGQGLGRRMLDQLMAEASNLGLRTIDLHVTESNTAALNLYESQGFRLKHNDMHLVLNLHEVKAANTVSDTPEGERWATQSCEDRQ